MSEALEAIKKIIDECSDEERRALKHRLRELYPHPLEGEWGIDADTILNAILRSSDLTQRGVRGIIAEAVFESEVLPRLQALGWKSAAIPRNAAFDVLLRKDECFVRIQIKLQRLEKGQPKLYYPKHYNEELLYVVETQKTRSGKRVTKDPARAMGMRIEGSHPPTFQTRPYRFGDFDILAVNLHPSTTDWRSFRYTLGSWLLPRQGDKSLIEIFQPVAAAPNEIWTDDLAVCIEWLNAGKAGSVLMNARHTAKSRSSRQRKEE